MKQWNKYFQIAAAGIGISILLQVFLAVFVDPCIAAVVTPFYPVWFILFIVGWRKEHPRK